jgi:diguanylate cyclase (GGDEF)-like protein/PAS domain S-box-containing protein
MEVMADVRGTSVSRGVALDRANALLELALADDGRVDLREQVVAVARALLPGVDVAFVEFEEQPLGGVTAPVTDDNGESLGVLRVSAVTLPVEDSRLLNRLAEVLGTSMSRGRRSEELARSERRMVEAQRISQVGSYDFEIATNTNIWSDQLYRIYGREPQSFNASYEIFLSMLHPDDREHVMSVHQRSMETLEPFEMEERVVWPDGQVRVLASWGEVVADDEGSPARMVGICWDITERRAIEQQLVHDALHDRLTGLPNRSLFVDRLTQATAGLARHAGILAVLFLDVDGFKVINDSLGHEVGDGVLLQVSERLSSLMRPRDTVARFGGDEFVVVCEDLQHPVEAVQIAERLLDAVRVPMTTGGSEVVVTVSVGIAIAASGTEAAGDLLRDADAAMHRAKKEGRARVALFADDMRAQALTRLETELDLRRALTSGELLVYYQPVIELESGAVVGAEALLRWQHPTKGLVLPGDVIPIAEETGLVVPLGAWVLAEACRQLEAWQVLRPGFTMAVNLSGVELDRPDFASGVAQILARTNVDPSTVSLEITETVLMKDAPESLAVLQALKALGVSISIDDFGTGYSSLSYLKRFPVDVLKIDRSFVSGLGQDPDDLAIVQAIVALARSLGMSTVAEGVETQAQLDVLRGLGCTAAQGYLLGRPGAADDLPPV